MDPQSLQDDTGVTTTRPGSHGAVSGDVKPACDSVPDARLIPADAFGWAGPVVAIRVGVKPGWRCTNGAWLRDEEVTGAQRLVPVGPLLELTRQFDIAADRAARRAEQSHVRAAVNSWSATSTACGQCAVELRRLLASMLGESTTRQLGEGDPEHDGPVHDRYGRLWTPEVREDGWQGWVHRPPGGLAAHWGTWGQLAVQLAPLTPGSPARQEGGAL